MSMEKADKDKQRAIRYSNAGDVDVALAVFDSAGRIYDTEPVQRLMTITPQPQEVVTFAIALNPEQPQIIPVQPAQVAVELQAGAPLW
jgi:hypothetical protein